MPNDLLNQLITLVDSEVTNAANDRVKRLNYIVLERIGQHDHEMAGKPRSHRPLC